MQSGLGVLIRKQGPPGSVSVECVEVCEEVWDDDGWTVGKEQSEFSLVCCLMLLSDVSCARCHAPIFVFSKGVKAQTHYIRLVLVQ
jgi:hypothetical protein